MKWLVLAALILCGSAGVFEEAENSTASMIVTLMNATSTNGSEATAIYSEKTALRAAELVSAPAIRLYHRVAEFVKEDSPIRLLSDYFHDEHPKSTFDRACELSGIILVMAVLCSCVCGPCLCLWIFCCSRCH